MLASLPRRIVVKSHRLSLLVVCLAFLAAAVAAFPVDEPISPSAVAEYVGKVVSVEGRVYQVRKGSVGIHLYFDPDPTQGFQALIPADALYKFKVDPMLRYDKRNVRVTGKIEEDSGRYFIRVTETKNIRVAPRKRGSTN